MNSKTYFLYHHAIGNYSHFVVISIIAQHTDTLLKMIIFTIYMNIGVDYITVHKQYSITNEEKWEDLENYKYIYIYKLNLFRVITLAIRR